METVLLTKVEVWELEYIIYKLYEVIKAFENMTEHALVDKERDVLRKAWCDFDTVVSDYFEKPTTYEFGSGIEVTLNYEKIKRLRDYVINSEALFVAIELCIPELHLHDLISELKDESSAIGKDFRSVNYLTMIKALRKDLWKWANLYSVRICYNLRAEISRRKEDPYLLSMHLYDIGPELKKFADKDSGDATEQPDTMDLDLLPLFKKGIDLKKLYKIRQKLIVLAQERREFYMSRIISIIVFAYYNNLLSCSYSKALKSVMRNLHLEVKQNHLHPATYGHPSVKGRWREAYQYAINFFKAIGMVNRYPEGAVK